MNRASKVSWALVIFFLIGGAVFTIVMPEIGIGQIWMGVALFLGALYFFMGRFSRKVEKYTGPDVQPKLVEALRNYEINAARSEDPKDRIARLLELRKAELITQQEFEDQRKRILEGI